VNLRNEEAAKINGRSGRKLNILGIVLPSLPEPGGNYLAANTAGNIVYPAGVICTRGGEVITGTAGANRPVKVRGN
jgi:hypothetical protein